MPMMLNVRSNESFTHTYTPRAGAPSVTVLLLRRRSEATMQVRVRVGCPICHSEITYGAKVSLNTSEVCT